MPEPQGSPRDRLLDAAVHLLAEHGPDALQARRITAEAGVSTMGVYTHFGGMQQLIAAVAEEGFRRFGAALAAVPTTEDAVVDFLRQGLAYRGFATANPAMYQLMFGLTRFGADAADDVTVVDGHADTVADATYAQLTNAVRRIQDSGRMRPELDANVVGARIWTVIHGYVLLELAGFFGHRDAATDPPGHGLTLVLLPLARALLLDLGDDPADFDRSAAMVVV